MTRLYARVTGFLPDSAASEKSHPMLWGSLSVGVVQMHAHTFHAFNGLRYAAAMGIVQHVTVQVVSPTWRQDLHAASLRHEVQDPVQIHRRIVATAVQLRVLLRHDRVAHSVLDLWTLQLTVDGMQQPLRLRTKPLPWCLLPAADGAVHG